MTRWGWLLVAFLLVLFHQQATGQLVLTGIDCSNGFGRKKSGYLCEERGTHTAGAWVLSVQHPGQGALHKSGWELQCCSPLLLGLNLQNTYTALLFKWQPLFVVITAGS